MIGKFSSESIEVRKKQQNIFPMLQENRCQSEISHPVKTFLSNEYKTKTFLEK
jgi:hypothetical protein